MKKLASAATLALSLAAAATLFAQTPKTPDPALKAPEVVKFIGLKPGNKVADIMGGSLTESLAQAVGKSGKVYAVESG